MEQRELLSGSGHVVLAFVHDGVAEQLTRKGHFQVPFGKEMYELKVMPYMSGEITDLQVLLSVLRPRSWQGSWTFWMRSP